MPVDPRTNPGVQTQEGLAPKRGYPRTCPPLTKSAWPLQTLLPGNGAYLTPLPPKNPFTQGRRDSQ